MIDRKLFVAAPLILLSNNAFADTFIDAAIHQMNAMKDNYKHQVGTRYTGTKSTAGLQLADCFRYTRTVLMSAFTKAGAQAHADKITDLYEDGGDVAKYLAESAGWNAYFWAPDVRVPGDGRDSHADDARQAGKTRKYFYQNGRIYPDKFVPLSGYIVNYNPTPISVYDDLVDGDNSRTVLTKKTTIGLEYLKSLPFCFGTTAGANHTFLLSKGKVYEVHWDVYGPTADQPDARTDVFDNKLYEVSSFQDDFSNYKAGGWLSGIIVCPPASSAPPTALATYNTGR